MPRPGVLTSIQKAKLLSDTSGLEYLTNRLNTEVTWIGGYGLGSGSYGEVTLWICIDNKTRMPLKECAIKDTFENVSTSTEEKGLYTNVYHDLVAKGMDFGVDPWSKFLGQADVERRFLKEAYLQGIMTEPDSKQEIFSVPLWGYARKAEGLRPGYNHWRLYLPLYDYGDMWDLIRDHLVMKRAIPEPFIWHTLHCLFTASEQLSQLPRKRKGATDSDVIVVFDMKPDNILLAPPNQNSTFPTYPRPHIADLGGGCLTNTYNDPSNMKGNFDCQMTEGYFPPEYIKPSLYTAGRIPCGEWTNVWQIGRVAEALMKLATGFDNPPYGLTDRVEDLESDIMEWRGGLAGQDYSYHLRRLVASCMKLDPSLRPSGREAVEQIETSPTYQIHMRGMKTLGTDAWLEEQEQKQAEKAASEPPATTTPPTPSAAAAQKAAATKKRKRMEDADYYLRCWDTDKRARFVKLGVLPDEDYDLLNRDKMFWATDYTPKIDKDGRLVKDIDYGAYKGMEWLKGHTASIGLDDFHIASSTTAVEGGEDDGGIGLDGGDGDAGNGGSFHYNPADFPDLSVPSPPGGTQDADDQGEDDDDDNQHPRSSDYPWITDPFGEREDDDQEEVDDQEDAEDDEPDSGSIYYNAPSEVWHSMSTHGPEDHDDQEEDDGDDLYHSSI